MPTFEPTHEQQKTLINFQFTTDRFGPCCHTPAVVGYGAAMRGRPAINRGPSLEEIAEAYLSACKLAGNVQCWIDQQEKHITSFIAYWEKKLQRMADAAPFHLSSWLAHCQSDRGNSSATLRRKGTVIRAWARWALKSGMVERCQLATSDLPKERPNPVEVATMEAYLQAIRTKQPRYSDEFRVFLGTGLRRGELLHLRWCDIDMETGVVHVKRRKGWSPKARKDRVVGMTQDAKAALAAICEKRKAEGSLGPYLDERGRLRINPATFTHTWLRFTRDNNLPPRLHATRHSHATHGVESGGILTDLQAQLGHADIRTTMRYVKANPDGPLRLVRLMDKEPREGNTTPDPGAAAIAPEGNE